jgi:hypothetical protein
MKKILIPLLVCGLFACKKDKDNPVTSQPTAVNEITTYLQGVDSLSEFDIALRKTAIAAADAAVGLTVFAPGNESIGSYDPGAKTRGKDLPDSIVKNHIVKGLFKAADLTNGRVLTALSGRALKVTVVDGHIYINGAGITFKDGDAGDQIVHTIARMIADAPGSADVKVFDAMQWSIDNRNGLPAAGATVSLYTSTQKYYDGTPDFTTTTDAAGIAHFTGIPAGDYYSVVTKGQLSDVWAGTGIYSLQSTDSLFQSESEVNNAAHISGAVPGDFRFTDINGDGRIDPNDKTAAPSRIITISNGELTTLKVLIGYEENHTMKAFKTADEASITLTSIAMGIGFQQKRLIMLDGIMSDDADCDGLPDWCAYDQFTFTSSDNTIADIWDAEYGSIRKLNRIIYSLPTMTGDTTALAAQARGLRAYAYLQLATYFGELPVTTDLEIPVDISRSSLIATYEFIKKDLTIASATLPVMSPAGATYRHMTEGAAKALLARVAIANNDFITAKSYATEVIQMGYALSEDTSQIFTDVTAPEIIWDLSYSFSSDWFRYFYGRSFAPITRLSEMYLISAEADIAMSNLGSAGEYINVIRLRDELSAAPISSPTDARDALNNTRKIEFSREGFRFADLVRWGQATQTLSAKGYKSFNSRLPIPLPVLQKYPNIYQNVGYN